MTATLRAQQPALTALAELARMCPELPGAHLSTYQHAPGEVVVQIDAHGEDRFSAFEAWREALLVPTDAVDLTPYKSQPGTGDLSFSTTVAGAPVHVWLALPCLPVAVAS